MDRSRYRRTAEEIIDVIYDALPVNNFDPISHIAAKANLDWKTAQKYLNLILHIQGKQGGDWLIKKKAGENFVYARKTMAGRPRE